MIKSIRPGSRLFAALLLALVVFLLVPAGYAHAEPPYKKCTPGEVHPIWWKAALRYDVQTKVIETREKITLHQGKKVTLVYKRNSKRKKIMLDDGTHCFVPPNSLNVIEDACTDGDYSKQTKIAFVNSRRLISKTKYLIWVSTDMQSLNIFTGSNRKWEFLKSYKCSTGMAGYETPIGLRYIVAKMDVCHSIQWESDLPYFLSFGGSGIHRWPGGSMRGKIGKHPCSHSCIRLSQSPAVWVYRHIPVGTRLLIY